MILDATPFETTYVRVVRKFADLGANAEGAAVGTSMLDRALVEAAVSASTAADAAGVLGRATLMEADAAMAAATAESTRAAKVTATSAALLREVDANEAAATAAARAAASSSEAALAESRLAQARLRAGAAQDRLTALQASGAASARGLAAAEATLLASTDRVTVATERLDRATALGARTNDRARSMWAAIPGPVKAAVAAITAIGVLSGGAATHFQDATTRIQTQANASRQQVDALRAGILGMTAAVATAPDTLADAAFHIASVGQHSLTTAQELDILRTAAEAAKLGHANLVDVTNALDAAVVAGIRGVSNYSQAMGVLNATVGAGDMTLQNLAEAFGPLAAVLKGYNVTIQQAGAALATFGDNNLRGADAGTALRMSVQALAVPAAAGRKELEAWGFWTGNLTRQLQHGGLTEALDALMKAMRAHGVTAQTQGDFLTETFGKRAGIGINILMGELDRYHNKLDEVTKGGNTFASAWTGYTHTLSYAWGRVEAGAEAAAVKIGDRLLPDATRALAWLGTTGADDVGKLWHAFTTNPDVTAGLHDVMSAVGDVVDAVRNAGEAAAPLARVLVTLGAGAAVVAFRVFATVLKDVAVALDDVTGFFAHNHAAAAALAGLLTSALIPALLRTGQAALVTGGEAAAGGLVKLGAAASAAVLSINPVTVALGVLTGVALFFWQRQKAAADAAKAATTDWVSHLGASTSSLSDNAHAITAIRARMVETIAAGYKTIDLPPPSSGPSKDILQLVPKLSAQYDVLNDARKKLLAQDATMRTNEDALGRAFGLTGTQVETLAAKSGIDLTGALETLYGKVGNVIAAAALSHHPVAQAAADLQSLGTAGQTAAQDVQSLKDALDELAGKALTADEAAITFRNDIAQLDTALKSSKGSLSIGTQPGRDARQAFDTAAKAALDYATALKDSGKPLATVRASLQASIAMLKAHAGASSYAKTGLAELDDALNAVNADIAAMPGAAGRSAVGLKATAPQFRAAGNAIVGGLQAAIDALPAALAKKNAAFRHAGFTVGESLAEGITIGIQQKSGAVMLTSEKLVKGVLTVMRNAAEARSPSRASMRLGGDIADGLPIGYLARQPQVLAAFKQGTTATLYAVTQAVHGMLAQANSRLSSDLQARSSAAQSVTSGIVGNYALASAFGPAGNVGNLSAYFGGGASTLARELALAKQLQGKHLAPGLLAEIAGLAPQQAIAAETSILSGQSGPIGTLNRNYLDVARYAGKIGNTVASAQFDQMIAHDKKALVEAKETNAILRELVAEYKKQPKALAAALDAAIRAGQVHR